MTTYIELRRAIILSSSRLVRVRERESKYSCETGSSLKHLIRRLFLSDFYLFARKTAENDDRFGSNYMARQFKSIYFRNATSYFFQIAQLSIRSGPPILDFSQFIWPQFREYVALYSDEKENCVAPLKGRSLLKKMKTASKSTHKPRRNDRSNYAPRRTHSPPDRSLTKKTPHFRTYSRRVLFDLPQTLHGGRARRKGVNHFSIQFIVFPLGAKCWFLATE